ncbi:diguanylate cyclase (GGDEF) domain-containing protein [Salinibacillus kushneri]|uniref:Diguanylate cyclase (GGDEF) domain-containing protein n=1 Tax=Salinibacillus kushneri TaxID=237682 RepID=A0A1I0JF41_9BACI|nr:sensor domain-containing diguanylate cyclase [Salinibacillus kushneri]SEU08742.1 diguanylate cyclase (GGDEF) domain-containing protein [Salinibacillus kushneri]
MTKQKKRMIWGIWLFVWPSLIFYIYKVTEPMVSLDGRWFDMISFAILMCIVSLFPIIVGGTPIFFIHGISFAVFLHFGLLVEIVLTQLAVMVLLVKLRPGKEQLFRIPANLTLFLLTSIIGAAIYYLFGGSHSDIESFTLNQQLPILGYILSIIFANQVLLHLLKMYMTAQRERFFSKSLFWDMLTSGLTIPVGYVLYLLYIELGAKAIYFVGIPFVTFSVIIQNYFASQKTNNYMQMTSNIGHKLTGKLNVKEVLDIFVQEISKLLNVDYAYIYDVMNTNETLTLIRVMGDTPQGPHTSFNLRKFQGISGTVYGGGEGLFYRNRSKWEMVLPDPSLPHDAESIISVPIWRNEKVVGVITIASKRKRAYEKYQYMLVEILANYLAVAIENARHYETTKQKSERCPLTKLYNYRYFEEYIQHLFEDMEAKGVQENHSLILLDLDFFKRVNDTYGHESGNEVLRELALRLENTFPNDLAARYGGEEFVVLLRGKGKDEALFQAETIRRIISDEPFVLKQHISNGGSPITVQVTASIGVATYPNDCDDPRELIRHADRAMYVGAKNNGRNKVATYEKVIQM